MAVSTIDALYNGTSEKLTTSATGITVTGNIANASGDFTLDVAGNIILDADGTLVSLKDGGTEFAQLYKPSAGGFSIYTPQVDKDISFVGNDGGSTITPLKIDMSAGGAINMPTQPAFLAQGNGQTDFPVNTATTLDFENERFDQGANFSSNTFTAPVTGRYLFACMVYTRNLDINTNYYQIQLITSNRTISAGLGTSGYDADMLYFPFSISLLVDMDFDDTAVLKMDVGSGGANQLIVESQTYFSGYLVA